MQSLHDYKNTQKKHALKNKKNYLYFIGIVIKLLKIKTQAFCPAIRKQVTKAKKLL